MPGDDEAAKAAVGVGAVRDARKVSECRSAQDEVCARGAVRQQRTIRRKEPPGHTAVGGDDQVDVILRVVGRGRSTRRSRVDKEAVA